MPRICNMSLAATLSNKNSAPISLDALFINVSQFLSSITDLLSAREAFNVRFREREDHDGGSSSASLPVEFLYDIARDIILQKFPSFEPLIATMSNSRRWLNIGRVLEMHRSTPDDWSHTRKRFFLQKLSAAKFETDFFKECHMTMAHSCCMGHQVEDENSKHSSECTLTLQSRFLNPITGEWIRFMVQRFSGHILIHDFWFETENGELHVRCGDSYGDRDTDAPLWELLTGGKVEYPSASDVEETLEEGRSRDALQVAPPARRDFALLSEHLYLGAAEEFFR